MTDQYTFRNPVTAYEDITPPEQSQPEPGLDAKMTPKADLGEDTYRGTGIDAGHRSLAYRVRLQAADRTLTDADVAEVSGAMVAAAGAQHDARQRS